MAWYFVKHRGNFTLPYKGSAYRPNVTSSDRVRGFYLYTTNRILTKVTNHLTD